MLLAPQIRRDFIDRMKQSTNKAKYFWESMKDNLVRREDETDLLNKSTLMDFEGNEFMSLPIYYTHKLKDMNDLSTDVASTMIAYASMINDYNKMNVALRICGYISTNPFNEGRAADIHDRVTHLGD